jgi:ATP-dependent exoDNAse (exonuclease V) beta subunit
LLDNSALLEHSNYSDVRSLENNLALLDDINVLYVAMTRPKSQLYIFLEESRGNSNSYNTLSKLFDYFFNDMNPNFPYVEGSLKRKEIQNDCQINSTYNLSYKSNVNWRSIIRLKNSSNQLWDVDQDKKEFGTQLHLWLSKIHYLIDVEGVLSTLKKSNLVSPILKISLIERIEKIFKNDLIKSFFDQKWSVKTETEILLKDGDVYVPDRVIFNNNKLVVIDYKTGSISNMDKHKSQLINYASILKQMGYDNIKLILIYTEDNLKIIEI